MQYASLLFDFDNTLVNTEPLMRHAFLASGCDTTRIDQLSLRSMSALEVVACAGQTDHVHAYHIEYAKLIRERPLLFFSDTAMVLEELRRRGIALGLVTTSTEDIVLEALAQCELQVFFEDCLITFSSCSKIKPNPDPILLALKQLGAKPHSTLYVGDSDRDIVASHAAGLDFALAGWAVQDTSHLGGSIPRFVLNQFADVLSLT